MKKIIEEKGFLPFYSEIQKEYLDRIISGIDSFGGINKFRKLLNQKINKRDVGWATEEVCLNCLKEIEKEIEKEINCFPSYTKLQNMGNQGYLIRAISKNGGFNKFKKLMGYKQFNEGYKLGVSH